MSAARRGGIEPAGSGRILLWRGGSIWIGRAEASTDFHAHHAIQITLSLSAGSCRFRSLDEEWKEYAAAIIAAHHPHAFEARGELVALVFVEPESVDGHAIRDRFRHGITALSADLARRDIDALAAAYDEHCADQELIDCARTLIANLAATGRRPTLPLDRRILLAIELLHERLDRTISLADVADLVHLSPERFRHLFVEATGIRFRPYVLWLRLGSAVSAYAAGASLTDAAHASGFADSAHLSRTFKRMFGVAPVSIRPE
ncbi:MAG: AraC family transcriptional regulator [Pseudomonadota bacterium]|nr:AraC family transcriptional regulator [Pseudomonadota bacterium]